MNLSDFKDHKEFLHALTSKPGVYRMLDDKDTILYVGKANNLNSRVSSYFNSINSQSIKTQVLMRQTRNVETTITRNEAEALILENNLIKEYKPRYNVLLRDDKSYPYIYLSSEQSFPRLRFHRGARKGKGTYFGPFPNSIAVRKTLNLLQKIFLIRSCEDSVFKNRTRPCLQYQIKRCTAPCVDLISQKDYQNDIANAVMFLEGNSDKIIESLYKPMQQAAESLDYERAAHYRDQISHLRALQDQQVSSRVKGDVDIVACEIKDSVACVQVYFLRSNLNLGNKSFFPKQTKNATAEDVLSAFIAQYYLERKSNKQVPDEIIVSHLPDDHQLLSNVLSEQNNKKVIVKQQQRGEKLKWLKLAKQNTLLALNAKLSSEENQVKRLASLQQFLKLEEPVERIECFDISHTQGSETVGSCVVFGANGMLNSDYRRFNIKGIQPGDDYAAMEQVLNRRYSRLQKEEAIMPALILIDGGKGQTARAINVLRELQLDYIPVIGVSKGPERKAGQEKLIITRGRDTVQLPADSPALHLIQMIRDEAHRFAITGHRQRRKKKTTGSPLENIAGVGQKRRQALIKHFGGFHGVIKAGVDDLALVPGINKQLAQKIYDNLHDS